MRACLSACLPAFIHGNLSACLPVYLSRCQLGCLTTLPLAACLSGLVAPRGRTVPSCLFGCLAVCPPLYLPVSSWLLSCLSACEHIFLAIRLPCYLTACLVGCLSVCPPVLCRVCMPTWLLSYLFTYQSGVSKHHYFSRSLKSIILPGSFALPSLVN